MIKFIKFTTEAIYLGLITQVFFLSLLLYLTTLFYLLLDAISLARGVFFVARM